MLTKINMSAKVLEDKFYDTKYNIFIIIVEVVVLEMVLRLFCFTQSWLKALFSKIALKHNSVKMVGVGTVSKNYTF